MAVVHFDQAGLKALVTNPCVRNNAEAVNDAPWSRVHAGRGGNTAHDHQLSCSYRSSCRWPYRGKQVTETKGCSRSKHDGHCGAIDFSRREATGGRLRVLPVWPSKPAVCPKPTSDKQESRRSWPPASLGRLQMQAARNANPWARLVCAITHIQNRILSLCSGSVLFTRRLGDCRSQDSL